jgi:hypothetical protein
MALLHDNYGPARILREMKFMGDNMSEDSTSEDEDRGGSQADATMAAELSK